MMGLYSLTLLMLVLLLDCVSGSKMLKLYPASRIFKMQQDLEKMTDPGSLYDVMGQLNLNIARELVDRAGLADELKYDGPFTLFGPTDEFLQNGLNPEIQDMLETNMTYLNIFLMDHVADGSVMSGDLKNEMLVSNLNGNNFRVNIYQGGKVITVNGQQVIKPDEKANNGVIHVINGALYNIPTMDIPTFFQQQGISQEFSTLVKLVNIAGLADTLAGGPFTLFAPPNQAFAKLPNSTIEYLMNNKTALTEVLEYHLLSGTYFNQAFTETPMTYPTVQGEKVSIKSIKTSGDFPNEVFVNNSPCFPEEIPVKNGVVYLIYGVLMPPSFRATERN